MKIDPIIKTALKHNRSFERLPNGDILVRAAENEPLELGLQPAEPWAPTPEQVEVASWFNRRATTEWSGQEKRKWREIIASFRFEGDEWNALKWYYTESGCPYLRKDLLTLLNNWNGEIDRAKIFDPNKK